MVEKVQAVVLENIWSSFSPGFTDVLCWTMLSAALLWIYMHISNFVIQVNSPTVFDSVEKK